MSQLIKEGTKVKSRDGTETGRATGATRRCQMAGCTGRRIVVKWPDGQITMPCSKGMTKNKRGVWRLL